MPTNDGFACTPSRLCLPPCSRRTLLKMGSATVVTAALPAGCGGGASVPSGPIAAGNVADVAADSLRVVSGANVVLARDPGGLYAMSAVCTHAGCIVAVVKNGGAASNLHCNCHGSDFASDGTAIRGPAVMALQHYQVDVAVDGTITIQGGQPVTSDIRTQVP
jgi:nitrite reductase/ring-hydroxylating ferredoxin subunit